MQFDVPPALLQRRPFALRLLHAILTEDALAGGKDGLDIGRVEGFRHGDERHRTWRTPGVRLGPGDGSADLEEAGGSIGHRQRLKDSLPTDSRRRRSWLSPMYCSGADAQ